MTTIQSARVEQVQQIKNLLSRTWKDTYEAMLPEIVIQTATTNWHSIEALTEEIKEGRVYFSVAIDEAGEVVGLATAVLQDETLILSRLYVDPGQQRQGIGGRLLQAAIDAHPTARKVHLEVERDNTKGFNFYKKMGFKQTGERLIAIEDASIPVIEMELPINTEMNFDEIFTHLTHAPGVTSKTHPRGLKSLPPEERIEAFRKSHELWVLNFANELITKQDSGFAVLNLTNSYMDMIAQLYGDYPEMLLGEKAPTHDKKLMYAKGLQIVFPYLANSPEKDEICEQLYALLRSSLAHMGLTGEHIIISEAKRFNKAITPGISGGSFAIVINPRLWLEGINQHFDAYISELQTNEKLREQFMKRIEKSY